MKGLFLDLDHTVIRPKEGRRFPLNIEDWVFIPGILQAIRKYAATHRLVIVSNQGGIEKGYQTEEETLEKFRRITSEIQSQTLSPFPVHFYFSKSMKGNDRKPNTGMADKAAKDLDIDLSQSIMVGDMATDRDFAKNAGIPTFFWVDDFIGS